MERELSLVQEELCRIIASAKRWKTIDEAWLALLTARRIAAQLMHEKKMINGQCGIGANRKASEV